MKNIRAVRLRCEYLENPLGIESLHPRLSWIVKFSSGKKDGQTAYQIRASKSPGGRLAWDSGRVASSENCQIAYTGKTLEPRTEYTWQVRVWGGTGGVSAWSEAAKWSTGQMGAGPDYTQWIGAPVDLPWNDLQSQPCPQLRKSFVIKEKIVRATAYVSALGLYELRLNGRRVGEHLFAPEWTDYHRRAQVQTYDVTPLLRKGQNVVGAVLGQGWYAGRIGMSSTFSNGGAVRGIYGRHLRLFCRIDLETVDGKIVNIFSDPSWKYTLEGPICGSDILEGEHYDARRELDGWDRPGFKDDAWKPAQASRGPLLVPQVNEPMKITTTLKPLSVKKSDAATYVFDLGQNMVGWARMKLKAPPGTKIRFRFGEVLQDDGTLYRENLRDAPQEDFYTCRGGKSETFEPHFTYHGFRYVEVQGLKKPPVRDDLTGCVIHSSSRQTGTFECSSDLLTRLMKAIQWTQRSNLQSAPTDCPQRDERLGWTGDIQVFAQTACFNMDMAAFFTKWLHDLRDAQTEEGAFTDYAPHPYSPHQRFSGNPGWGDAGVLVPWRVYCNYNDLRILEESFPAAKKWIDFVHRHNPDLIWRNRRGSPLVYGDWLNGDTFRGLPDWPATGGQVPIDVYATSFFAYSTEILARMAKVLGHRADAAHYSALARKIREAYNRSFVAKDGKVVGDTQAGYALALHFDLLPKAKRALAARHLVEALKPYNGSMSTGIQSTVRMMLELSRFGYHEEAYALINKTTMPSWGYMIENGGTTIWERWDGWVKGRGFQDPSMNSFNHYAIGAVGEWMWRAIIGLNPDENAPGWKHFIVRPVPGGGLTAARGVYESIRGPIEVTWHIEKGTFNLKVGVPSGTTAQIELPSGKTISVKAGLHSFSCKMPPSFRPE